ncbi:MAG: carbohydrate-binding family 9-like protein [Thermoanaerobaculia bacterium]|nr:carbohydrate-binding family 9-like protein [Thermoanaerobaculia bacterium]
MSEDLPELRVRRVEGPVTPWFMPEKASAANLVDSVTGELCRLTTSISVYRDAERLFVSFSMEDEGIVASRYERDDDLWKEDVVEIFLAPRDLEHYFELEVNPLGTLFDARVSFPGPTRATMTVDKSWDCPGFAGAVKIVRTTDEEQMSIFVTIPFSCLGDSPGRGDRWRANFFRIDRSSVGDTFAAWSPTFSNPPDFHVPSRFGHLLF